ncbi:hypothetical protein PHYSODRAFT_295929 [Phytophthora sojae]|uniref:Uncharacterized protein n=1 Tax=Phytophthora sojae (strain P6497) TaxID=1094619 RepID=G4YU47_PHYSP|nr:hypothetical protein PHYSODRAFT_295929 [Phytophthora sojae]EGZ23602.1 hypothetical protein PHYSODRAFT_295929 [Phytophthora sojae]|eukprot:XP_009518890.1 hypothetical protein PHYSODRAFT_295929 [Phytophthora sojae]
MLTHTAAFIHAWRRAQQLAATARRLPALLHVSAPVVTTYGRMEASHAAISMEQRWGFLNPWCQALAHKVQYTRFRCEGSGREGEPVWESKGRQLQVAVGSQRHAQDAYIPSELVRVREALALLAAVAHVDHEAWKYLLHAHCKLNWWRDGEENLPERLPARFVLKLPQETVADDLARFFGVDHREQPSGAYVEAMKRVAAFDHRLQPTSPGVDIEVPIRVAYGVAEEKLAAAGHPDQLIKGMRKMPRTERNIRQEWDRLHTTDVESGSIRCTFVLEPMVMDIQESGSVAKTAGMMERYVLNNFWFSLVSVKAKLASESGEPDTLIAFRQLMIALFDGARRDPALAHTRYHGIAAQRSQLQLGKLVLHADGALDPLETEALFSSLVLNQTAQRLTAWVYLMSNEQDRTNIWWKWLAYGCFSKRARTHSALRSLELNDIGSLSLADVEAFLAILDSEGPEEVLYGFPHGQVEGRDATLKDGALVQYDIQEHGQSRSLTFTSCRFLLHTFSDDGSSEWVNVLVPGFGRCLVRRSDLVFKSESAPKAIRPSLSELSLKFYETATMDGLTRFLAAVGSSLSSLKIANPGDIVDTSVILRCCPNLRELTLSRGLIDMHFKFDQYRGLPQAISTFRPHWENIAALATSLTKESNPLVKCISELRIRLVMSNEADDRAYESNEVRVWLDALLQMLAVNKHLQYLEVKVSMEHSDYLDSFRRHHHEIIRHNLSLESKIAFLSVLPNPRTPTEAPAKKKCATLASRRQLLNLGQTALSKIFAYAAEPVTRRVCFRAF